MLTPILQQAIHAMPILGGEGGNMAIKDAVELSDHLATNHTKHLKEYASSRYMTWQTAVENGEMGLAHMHATTTRSL